MALEYRCELGGRPLVLEFGEVAKQANGSVLVRYGDTVVLVTATMSKEPRQGIDFFPLLVDYEERMYAVGKIPGGWGRREGRPGEEAILSARLIDRPLRPLFPDGFRNDVQVVVTVLSVDKNNAPAIAGMIGASAALHISDIPFGGPIAGIKVGLVDGEYVVNPTLAQNEVSILDLTVAGTKDAVMMVEAGANEVTEEQALGAIMFAHDYIKELCALQEKIRAEIGRPKVQVPLFEPEPEMEQWVREFATERLKLALRASDKQEREQAIDTVREQLNEAYIETFGEEIFAEKAKDVGVVFDSLMKEEVRRSIIVEGIRPDGRKRDEIRPITCRVGVLPRTHGSGLFTRGQTQVLTVCTLGLKSDEQLLDNLTEEDRKRYIHHYNFPAFSVGEVRPIRGPGRREIGHGALAERALLPMIPKEEEFPYTIRLVSEVLESNGSTSQASVCGSTLSLMDAGVPIRKPVAGIAMGLVKYGEDFAILTDIQGIEDALGDMDFKVAGTRDGITALQMDIKISGVSREILQQALEQARIGRLFILNKMAEAIKDPRPQLSPYAPRIITMEIPVDKIRDVIGPGGKTIRKIIEQTGVSIDIEDDGRVYIASTDGTGGEQAKLLIERYVKDVEVGASYLGTVKRIMNFGAFVEILPGKEGLVHISQLAHQRVKRVEDVVNIGDEIMVKVIEIDRQGRINLSRKELLPKEEQATPTSK
ncbi:MAG: polyribonucleotide nucleotidyltransferase [Firmicutes bacterium]|jgi:polyribonucleotide nucleotidyltransferase|nr:polyribonucleotide nucleotidyltransferase [Bacillota bacterium]